MIPSTYLEGQIDTIRRHATLFDTDRQAVIGTTVSGEIVYWSRTAERIYGWAASDVTGRQILDVTPSSHSVQEGMKIMSLLQKGRSWSGTFDVRTRNGLSFKALVRDLPVMGEFGELLGIVGVSAVWRPPLHDPAVR